MLCSKDILVGKQACCFAHRPCCCTLFTYVMLWVNDYIDFISYRCNMQLYCCFIFCNSLLSLEPICTSSLSSSWCWGFIDLRLKLNSSKRVWLISYLLCHFQILIWIFSIWVALGSLPSSPKKGEGKELLNPISLIKSGNGIYLNTWNASMSFSWVALDVVD